MGDKSMPHDWGKGIISYDWGSYDWGKGSMSHYWGDKIMPHDWGKGIVSCYDGGGDKIVS